MAWLRLQTVHTQIGAANVRLQQLKRDKKAMRVANVMKLKTGATAAYLRLNSATMLEAEERRVGQLLDHLAQQRRVAEKGFMNSRRDREIVENAIALERAAYESERNRREQAAVDDETLQRLTRNREKE